MQSMSSQEKPARHNRSWNAEEDRILVDLWGDKTPDAIAKELGRTTIAVRVRAKAKRLGTFMENSEYIGLYQCTQILGIDSHVPERLWIPKYKMPFRRKKTSGNLYFKVIRLDRLMEWLKKNQDLWDSRKVKPYALGTEPEWLQKKRAADAAKPTKPVRTKYTREEDDVIVRGVRKGLTYKQIGEQIRRSSDSVQNRAYRLDIWGTGKLKPKGERGPGSGKALY